MALRGLPGTLEELRSVGAARAARVEVFCERFRGSHPDHLWDGDPVPFALPFFGADTDEARQRVRRAVVDAGFRCDVYRLDVARDMAAPDYRPCLLLPAHHEVTEAAFEELCRLVDDEARRR